MFQYLKSGKDFHFFDLQEVRNSLAEIRSAFPTTKIHYAVKANPAEYVLKLLDQQGVSFEIASEGELKRLKKLKVAGDRIIYSNPAKSIESIKAAYEYGVRLFVSDSDDDITNLREYAPGSGIILRIATEIDGNICDSRFGLSYQDAVTLGSVLGNLQFMGFTFHVGTHNTNPELYEKPLASCARILQEYLARGFCDRLRILDLGGGLPAWIDYSVPSYETYAHTISRLVKKHGLEPEQTIMEPGRSSVANAGLTIGTITNVKAYNDPDFNYAAGQENLRAEAQHRSSDPNFHFGRFVVSDEGRTISFGPHHNRLIITVTTGRYSAGLDLGFKPHIMRIEGNSLQADSEHFYVADMYGGVTANLDAVCKNVPCSVDAFTNSANYAFVCEATGAYKQGFQSEWCSFSHPTTILIDGDRFIQRVSGRGR